MALATGTPLSGVPGGWASIGDSMDLLGEAVGYETCYFGYAFPPGRAVAQLVLSGVAQLVKHQL